MVDMHDVAASLNDERRAWETRALAAEAELVRELDATRARLAALEMAQRHAAALSFPSAEAESYFVAGYSRGYEAATS